MISFFGGVRRLIAFLLLLLLLLVGVCVGVASGAHQDLLGCLCAARRNKTAQNICVAYNYAGAHG